MTIRVCMCCKKVMGTSEDGRVEILETHGCCLPCAKEKYPEAYEFMKKQQEERDRMAVAS